MGPLPLGGGGGGRPAALAAEDPTPVLSLPSEVCRPGGGAPGLTMAALPKQTYTLACMLSFSHGVLPRVNGNLNARMSACIINAVITRPRAQPPDDKLRRARSVVTCLCIAVVD